MEDSGVNSKLRVIVIGGGRIALSHLPHLIAHSRLILSGVVEPNLWSRIVLRLIFRCKVFRSLDSVDLEFIDAAFILTPPTSHISIAKRLVAEGKNVFIEKPLSLNRADSEALARAASEAGVFLGCGYVYRFHPMVGYIKKMVAEGGLRGRLHKVSLSMKGNVVSADSPKSWRNVGAGSGCIHDYGSHVIDLSIFWFGRPAEVALVSKEEVFVSGVLDRVRFDLKYHDFPVEIEIDWACQEMRKAEMSFTFHTDTGELRGGLQHLISSDPMVSSVSIKDLDTRVEYYLRGEDFQRQLDGFVSGCLTLGDSNIPMSDGVDCDIVTSQLEAKIK